MEPSRKSMDRAINFVFMAKMNKNVSIEAMQDALNRIHGRHYALEYGNKREVQHSPSLRNKAFPIIEISDDKENSWQEIAAKEMAVPFPADGPFVRITLLHSASQTELVLAFDHQVCDGLSGILFLRDLFFLLNHPQEKLPALAMPLPIWEILPEKAARDWLGKLRIAFFIKFMDFSIWRNRNKPAATFDPHYRVDAFELDTSLSQALVDACRREKTSVHAAISVAWMLALQAMINESGAEDGGLRSVSSPVSLRHMLPEEIKACAGVCYSTVVSRMENKQAHDFWEAARQIKNGMDAECMKSSFYDMPRFFKAMYERQLSLPEGETFKVPELPVEYDFSISNMGKLDAWFESNNEHAEYKIEAIYGPVVNAFKGEKTVGVCTLNGKIRFVFTTFAGDMEDTFIQTLIEKVQARLKIATDSNAVNPEP